MQEENKKQAKGKEMYEWVQALVSSVLVDVSPQKLTTQVLPIPEGKVFSGWVKETVGEDGKTTLTVMFTPDENGVVYLSEDTRLEPMVLYALFESAGEGQ